MGDSTKSWGLCIPCPKLLIISVHSLLTPVSNSNIAWKCVLQHTTYWLNLSIHVSSANWIFLPVRTTGFTQVFCLCVCGCMCACVVFLLSSIHIFFFISVANWILMTVSPRCTVRSKFMFLSTAKCWGLVKSLQEYNSILELIFKILIIV